MCVVAIHQPNFLPWLGYFHKLLHCDVFIFLDDVQLSRGKSFTSRTMIKSPSGPAWLTAPVKGKGDLLPIKEVTMGESSLWKRKHLKTLEANYGKASYFKEYFPLLRQYYMLEDSSLASFNINLIEVIAKLLSAAARLVRASEIEVDFTGPRDHLVQLVKKVGGSKYLTGKGRGSQRYYDQEAFEREGIIVLEQEFSHPVYPQLWGEFAPNLSVIDLILNCGPDARRITLSGDTY